ncbi:MAG: hypothetical protein ACTSWQ_04585 [Candidatus Thorarchaeota archaeon]
MTRSRKTFTIFIVSKHSEEGRTMKFSKEFSHIRRSIKRGRSDEAIELLNTLQEQVQENRIGIHKALLKCKAKPVSYSDSYLEVFDDDCATHKLTVNSATGRVTLKVSDRASEHVRTHMIKIAEYIRTKIINFPTITFRGKISFVHGTYQVGLASSNGMFSKRYGFDPAMLDDLTQDQIEAMSNEY